MKNLTYILICLTTTSLFGQDAATKTETRIEATQTNPAQPAPPHLTKFDLDFPGGTPAELVAAIQRATGRPINAIVPVEYAGRKLPPLKMSRVDVPQLFKALLQASYSSEWSVGMNNQRTAHQVEYGFKTEGDPRGFSDETIWSFFEVNTQQPPSASRFYLLTPYLDAGLTVDDITTAIQTGWHLQGIAAPPKLNFHKETRLLIAVGNPDELETIDSVLRALDAVRAKAAGDKAPTEAKTKP